MSVGQIHDAKSDNLEVFYNGPKSGVDGVWDSTWAPQFARPAAGRWLPVPIRFHLNGIVPTWPLPLLSRKKR